MIPKIEFRYSWVYDDSYRSSPRIQKVLKEQGKNYPSPQKIKKYIERVEPLWKKIESKTLTELSNLSGLKWKEESIRCYIIGFGRPFSDPLTMKLFDNKNDFIDTLTHELIHQIKIQNSEKLRKWYSYIERKYANEPRTAKNHIFLHALHWQIYLNLFNEKRLNRNIDSDKEHPDYHRSWQIVQEKGYENIIKEFRKRLK